MVFLLWVPTAEHAARIEDSAAALWPDAPVEVRVGEPVGDGMAWDGDTLLWVRGEDETEAAGVVTSEAAVVLARSWLREPQADLGWVPAPRIEDRPTLVAIDPPDSDSKARGWAGIGLGERFDVVGRPDALRLHGGVRWPHVAVGAALSSAIPRNRVPNWAFGSPRGGPIPFDVGGVGLASHVLVGPWGLEAGSWTVSPVALLGGGVRQVALRVMDPDTLRPQALTSYADVGPELGLGVEAVGPSLGFRGVFLDRMGFVDVFKHHVVLSVDLLALL